jgi:uncharacterized protein with PIN domain
MAISCTGCGRQYADDFGLTAPDRLFTRCRLCNLVLEPIDRECVHGRIPTSIADRAQSFAECSGCGRVYWEGSHTDRMRSVLARVFGPRA